MKILNTTSKTFEGNNLDYYDFDKLSSFEDVKFLLEYLEKIKFKLDYFYVSEFGDYEDVPLRVSYSKDDIDKVLTDFAGKKIDLYKLIGSIDDYRLVASVYPDLNRLELEYAPMNKIQLDSMIAELNSHDNNISNAHLFNK